MPIVSPDPPSPGHAPLREPGAKGGAPGPGDAIAAASPTAMPGLRVLTFSTLYPSAARPRHGIFVETRLRELVALGGVDTRVIAPVPWFPSTHAAFGDYARFARTPGRERRCDIDIVHPRYLTLPRIGMALKPHSLARTALRAARRLAREGFDPDVIDAHYFYPDGVAAALLAARLRKPFLVTARGSDLNLLAETPSVRESILRAAAAAFRVLCVSSALRERAIAIGIDAAKVEVLRNGVDATLFAPHERAPSRAALELPALRAGPLLCCVGNLVPEKGFELAVDALARLPVATLLIIGEGPSHALLMRLAQERGVAGRVLFRAPMPQSRLALAYSAADIVLLPSLREGWPNVILEALACGTPVIAADVGGVREILEGAPGASIIPRRSAGLFAQAIERTWRLPPARQALREHALQFDWPAIARRQRELLRSAAAAGYADSPRG